MDIQRLIGSRVRRENHLLGLFRKGSRREVPRPFEVQHRPERRIVLTRSQEIHPRKGRITEMSIPDFLDPSAIIEELGVKNRKEALEKLCGVVADLHPDLAREEMVGVLLEREKLGSTGVGDGVAIPHGKLFQSDRLIGCFGRSREGVEFDAVDNGPVHLFFLLFAPANATGGHLRALAEIARLLKGSSVREELLCADSKEQIYGILTGQAGAGESMGTALKPPLQS